MFEDAIGAEQPQVGLVRGQRGELTAAFLRRGLVVTVQHHGVTGRTPRGEPLDGLGIALEPVATLEPRRHQQ